MDTINITNLRAMALKEAIDVLVGRSDLVDDALMQAAETIYNRYLSHDPYIINFVNHVAEIIPMLRP